MFYEDERAVLGTCLSNLVRYAEGNEAFTATLCRWLCQNEEAAGILAARFVARSGKDDDETYRPVDGAAWRTLADELGTMAAGRDVGRIDRNLKAFTDAMAFAPAEAAILRTVCWYGYRGGVARLFDTLLADRLLDSEALLAVAADVPVAEIWRAMTQDGLAGRGLLHFYVGDADDFAFWVTGRLKHGLYPPNDGLADVERALVGAPQAASLAWSDFDHEAAARDFIRDILGAALRGGETGVNILLHGPPGAGKTELCRTLAAELDCALFAPGESHGRYEPSRKNRLEEVVLAQSYLSRRPAALLLFDEMEDLTAGRAGSKVFVNRLLERNRVPVLWTSNSIADCDPALLRRMTFIHEMKEPPHAQRERHWQRILEGIPGQAGEAASLARRYPFTPGVAAGAVRAATLADGNASRLGLALDSMSRALYGRRPAADTSPNFEPELVAADADVPDLLDRLSRQGMPRDFSLCLFGPPGTGKSAMARALADRLGIEARQVRASDLLSKWLGESEQKIAEAFARARADGVFLIIDEADSLLSDRTGAVRSWEVSQVNEMLTWMESHPLPFACSTNLMDRLDPASLRRFTFKVRFDYLDEDRIDLAFRRFFGRPAPDAARRLNRLTPGDFAVVANRLRFAPDADDAAIAALLTAECALKPGGGGRIGF